MKQQLLTVFRRLVQLFAGVTLLIGATATAQSTRPGWGATPYHDVSGTGVTFRVWTPNATSATVPGLFNGWSQTATPLAKEYSNSVWTGVWSADVAGVTNGTQYKFYFNGNLWKQDPRARLVTQSGSAGNSIVYDPNAFNWSGDNFTNPPQKDLFIYELHIGTFPSSSSPSRFVAATNKLDYLKSLGVNVVELMPVWEFPGNNSWGYNPAQIYAIENQAYGGTDGLKTFVKACHDRGLAVFMDVIHNHYGPSDLEMWNFDGYSGGGPLGGGGIYFYESNTNLQITPWGNTRPNFSSNQVANFIQDNFTMWMRECHVDGFRWDTPGAMLNGNGGVYIPAADSLIYAINTMIHTNTGKVSISEDVYNYDGFDSAWDTSYPGYFTPVLSAASDSSRNMSVVANAVQYNVRYGGTASSARVAYLESHDVVGDLNGPNNVRLVTAIDPATPNSYRARKLSTLGSIVTLTAPGIPMIFQGQEMLENQQFDSSLPVDWSKTITYTNIVKLYRDLIGARRNLKGYTPGLEGDQCSMLWVDNTSKLVAFHRWNSAIPSQDAVVIANFANVNYTSYNLNFPSAGTWYVHFNSDSTNYGSDFGNNGSTVVTASGNPATASVAIGPYSALILSQTPEGSPTVTVSPQNLSVQAGSNAVFTANGYGFPPLNYQWLNSTGSIAGATNATLTITNVQSSDDGNYSVIVSNLFGSATSSVVTLTVTFSSQYAAVPTNGTVPLTVQFAGPTTDSGGNTITQWSWGFGDGSTSTLQNPTHVYTNAGTFNPILIATNNFGSAVPGFGPAITATWIVANGGFETGDFTGWTLSGDNTWTVVDDGHNSGIAPNSGNYEAALGTAGAFGYLSQNLITVPGTSYLLSFWLNHSGQVPDDVFSVSWHGSTLLDETNPPAPDWTNIQFVVSATGTSTLLQFGYEASGADYLGLDDVSVVALPPSAQPGITGISLSGSNLVISGTNGVSGQTYFVLSATNLAQPRSQWLPVATNVLNTDGNFTITATNAVNADVSQAFYMLQTQ